MKLHLSWAGVEMLRVEPLLRLPLNPPKYVPIRLSTTDHSVVIVDASGVVWLNDAFAGVYDEGKPVSIILEIFAGHNQDKAAVVDYQILV